MKKIFAAALCVILLVCSLTAFAACDKPGTLYGELDMSLREGTLYGLYWYGDDIDDCVVSKENLDVRYYDPEKPTLIYSHGWKTESEDKEIFKTLADTYSATNGASGRVDYVAELKALGYNVAFWDWYEYAHTLGKLQNEIWTVKSLDEAGREGTNYYNAIEALDGRTIAGEFVRSVCAVMKHATNKEVIFVGHSFGGQVVTAAAYTLYKLADAGYINENIIPDRISLADPYIPGTVLSGKMDLIGEETGVETAMMDANAFEYLNSKGAVIDLNGAMVGMTYEMYKGTIKDADTVALIDGKIKENTVYVIQQGLTNAYGTVGKIHVISRDYILTSIIEGKKGNMENCVPNSSMTSAQLKAFVGREFNLVCEGFNISGATMEEIIVD